MSEQTDIKIIDGFAIHTFESFAVEPSWIAVNMTVALERLEGYNLTEEEKTSMPHLMAGYCRLIDEWGLEGHGDTEFEAIQDLFSKATKTESHPLPDTEI